MKASFPLMPGSVLGLMGGGQLGRMFAQAAARMGYEVVVLEKGQCPASEVSAMHIDAGYTEAEALKALSSMTAAVTTEFENVPAESLSSLAQAGCLTAPASYAVSIAQDRLDEKTFLEKVAGVPVAPHAAVLSIEDIDNLDEALFPGILKTTRLGYDGKGQAVVANKDDARRAFKAMGEKFCILEKRLALANEVSVIVCRGLDGQTVTFPVCENHHRNGILAQTVIPARISEAVSSKARAYATDIARALQYQGVLCIEFFVLEDGSVVANEMAPRPHNSGHATLEACETSQFEEQVRAMTGMPLGETTLVTPAVMLNILGDAWFDENDQKREPAWDKVLSLPGVKLHLYGKKEARRARKMGHLTVIGKTVEEALERAKAAARVLGLPQPW